jgi:hypothetical protein
MDQSMARKPHKEAVSLPPVESALLLATLRHLSRACRSRAASQNPFAGILLARDCRTSAATLPVGYLDYLRLKVHRFSRVGEATIK